MSYTFYTYADNWSFYKPGGATGYAAIAPNVTGINSFAVVNDDGNLDVRYPVAVATESWNQGANPNATKVIAVGGWSNSNLDVSGISNMGLLNVITNCQGSFVGSGGLTGPQKMLINTLFMLTGGSSSNLPYDPSGDPQLTPQVQSLSYEGIVIDFEGFAAHTCQKASMVTTFMTALRKAIPSSVFIHMAIPGFVSSQGYLEIKNLMALPGMKFHLMLYDYAAGLNSVVVTSNASLVSSYMALEAYKTYTPDLSILQNSFIGFPNYGRGFVVATGLNPATLATSIASGSYQAKYAITSIDPAFDDSGLISDDAILAKIGSWDTPTNGWALVTVPVAVPATATTYNPPKPYSANDYYYYNASNGLLISAFPNGTTVSSIKDLASLIKSYFPGVYGFMNWEAEQEYNQSVKKMTSLQNALTPTVKGPIKRMK